MTPEAEAKPEPTGGAVELRAVGRRRGTLEVLDGIDLTVEPGSSLALVGPSGCGKTTALELICGLQEPDDGAVSAAGVTDAAGRLAACAFMPQRDLLLPWLSALDNAAIAARNRGASRGQARETAAPLFEHFGLAGFERRRPAELSAGMRQRVAFLRTLLADKPVLLLDEPFAALDAITKAELQSWLLSALTETPRTTVLVTHDVEEALYVCDRVAVLSPRPARVVELIDAPATSPRARTDQITAPDFVTAREHALAALEGGHR